MKNLVLIFFSFFAIAQQSKSVDFQSVLGKINLNTAEKSVVGTVTFKFNILKITDSIYIDAIHMKISDLQINNTTVAFKSSKKKLIIFEGYKKGQNTLSFKYEAAPKQTLYFIRNEDNLQIWTQGQGKYTSHWFPSFDDVNEKLIFGLDIKFDKNFEVISNGIMTKSEIINSLRTSSFRMQKPMSSYLLLLAIGKFSKKVEKSTSGLVLENYLDSKDITKYNSTYQKSTEIFNFLESEIGFDYPWQTYKQIPVRDFLYAGMENTSATVFAQDFVLDSIGSTDKSYCNVNAHELAHQWFGNVVTAKSGKHHWLQEGFATYYALLAEKHLFGDNYFNWKLYENAENLQKASQKDSIPILNEKASSLTFYQKGAWALHYLRTEIGEENFKIIVKNYLKKYQFKNVETDDFLNEIKKVVDFDTGNFKKLWLENTKFPVKEALDIVKKNQMMQQYFEIGALKDTPIASKEKTFKNILQSNTFYAVKQEVIYQLQDVSFQNKKELLQIAMQTNDLKIRQTIAETLQDFPAEFRENYQTLLHDKSYVTREIALNTLWNKFPETQVELLEKSKEWIGFNDMNLRILWLNLALRTIVYNSDQKPKFYDELLNYTSPNYETEIRKNAFQTLWFLDKNDVNSMPNLVNGLTSHRWQMVKFSRDKIRNLMKIKTFREYFETLLIKCTITEKALLQKLISENL